MTRRFAHPDVTERATGTLHVFHDVHFKRLHRPRGVVVWLPPGYERSRASYPVLYMHDGQNLFDAQTAFLGQNWGVDEIATRLIELRTIVAPVVVGIYNTGEHRIDEYTPSIEPRFGRGGQAAAYGRTIVEELSADIGSHYRVRTGPRWTGLAGSSLGGLATLSIGLAHPRFFGRLGAMSPSVWWNKRHIVDVVRELPGPTRQRIWLDMGTREGRGLVDSTRTLRDELVAKGWRLDRDIRYVEALNARHNERAWARRLGPMLEFLFPRKP